LFINTNDDAIQFVGTGLVGMNGYLHGKSPDNLVTEEFNMNESVQSKPQRRRESSDGLQENRP
jgi:hypothetical protein